MIGKMFLREMRKRASDMADDMEEASAMLQHSSTAVTAKHCSKGVEASSEALKSVPQGVGSRGENVIDFQVLCGIKAGRRTRRVRCSPESQNPGG
jgi:hypothetical protein